MLFVRSSPRLVARAPAAVGAVVRVGVAVTLGALAACSVTACQESTVLPGDDVTVARVNGSEITEYDLARTLDKTLGQFAVPGAVREARKNALESMMEGRALAQKAEAELSEKERQLLDKEVAAFREGLLIKNYLAEKAPPAPLTEEKMLEHYRAHPERFGARTTKLYELVGTARPLAGPERASVMKLLSVSQGRSWEELAKQLDEAGVPATRTSGSVSDPVLDSKLRAALEPLDVGQTTGIVFVGGRAFVGGVVGKRDEPPRPFSEVRLEIDKALRVVLLRDAVKKVGADALAAARVERVEEKP